MKLLDLAVHKQSMQPPKKSLFSARYAHAWNHFKRKHNGKFIDRAHEVTKKSKYSKPLNSDEEMEHDNPSYCNPPCTKHGVCNDNRCFCKTPWTGSSCQHQIKVEKR